MTQESLHHEAENNVEMAFKESLKFYELRSEGRKRTLFSAWTQPIPIMSSAPSSPLPNQSLPTASNLEG